MSYKLLHDSNVASSNSLRNQTTLLCSIFLNVLLVSAFLVSAPWKSQRNFGGAYENGFASDLELFKPHIEMSSYAFTGGVELNEDGTFSTNNSSSNDQYTGTPSRFIDESWTRLLAGLNLDIIGHESPDIVGTTFQWPDDEHYFTGLDVFHSLHCLNRIRQALHPEYYKHTFGISGDPSRELHLGHCIDQIRQALQCHADLTPMQWTQVGGKVILRSDTPHTCRNFEKIHAVALQWRTEFERKESLANGELFIVD